MVDHVDSSHLAAREDKCQRRVEVLAVDRHETGIPDSQQNQPGNLYLPPGVVFQVLDEYLEGQLLAHRTRLHRIEVHLPVDVGAPGDALPVPEQLEAEADQRGDECRSCCLYGPGMQNQVTDPPVAKCGRRQHD
jgi:hypothetical protein